MFENLYVPDNIKNTLSLSVENNKISHAYLFCGKDEKTVAAAAEEFAKAVLCKNAHKPCNECSSCKKSDFGSNPDIIKIFPQGASISIKQIKQDLIKTIKMLPYESDKKIYIVYNADTMQKPAQNSLLKTLEEANNYAIIILCAASKNSFYPTILSRCQTYDFTEYVQNEKVADIVFKTLECAARDDYEALMEGCHVLSEENFSDVLMQISSALRDIMAYSLSKNKNIIINKAKTDKIIRMSEIYNTDKLKKTVDYIYDIRINASANRKLIIESIFLYLGI
ncbi:MAG: hypothetical protein GYA50_10565 [Eubacteriaceae bacterium]|nr:hypothetical protein [Eubacteriaceae bacterium]